MATLLGVRRVAHTYLYNRARPKLNASRPAATRRFSYTETQLRYGTAKISSTLNNMMMILAGVNMFYLVYRLDTSTTTRIISLLSELNLLNEIFWHLNNRHRQYLTYMARQPSQNFNVTATEKPLSDASK